MATTRNAAQAQAAQTTQLCDYCHLKPKFSNHAYCSKTCGTQAATLCNYCHKKPKFQNFEFCGKACASLAAPAGGPQKPVARGPLGPNAAGLNQPRSKAAQNQQQQGLALDPLQIAKLVMQQMPQVQALLNPGGNSNGSQPYQTSGPMNYGPSAQAQPPTNNNNMNPFMNPPAQNGPMMSNGNGNTPLAHFSSSNNGVNYGAHSNGGAGGGTVLQQYDDDGLGAEDLDCLIPGCGKPVHVDAKGLKTSDYCSQRHRDEAVASGLVSPCIMCLTKPQSHLDYFCGRTCREESLNKHYEAAGLGLQEDEDEQGVQQ